MGGLPKPDGVTVKMGMDMTNVLGKEYAYSYVVGGFSEEKYKEYIELISEQFPSVVTETQVENRFVHIAASSDGEHNVLVECNGDLEEGQIRYYK
ncbi:MAG: hypothetical protein GX091_00545 [Peptococcaceae bacterium]|nr:hypothetical protein [Peptococcaceae bacterium]